MSRWLNEVIETVVNSSTAVKRTVEKGVLDVRDLAEDYRNNPAETKQNLLDSVKTSSSVLGSSIAKGTKHLVNNPAAAASSLSNKLALSSSSAGPLPPQEQWRRQNSSDLPKAYREFLEQDENACKTCLRLASNERIPHADLWKSAEEGYCWVCAMLTAGISWRAHKRVVDLGLESESDEDRDSEDLNDSSSERLSGSDHSSEQEQEQEQESTAGEDSDLESQQVSEGESGSGVGHEESESDAKRQEDLGSKRSSRSDDAASSVQVQSRHKVYVRLWQAFELVVGEESEDGEWETKTTQEFYTSERRSVLWPPLLERRHIPPDPLSPQSLQDIEDWISECSNEHLFCRHTIQRRPVLPRRVLKIDSATDPLTVRLVESDGEKARYIALSYCWGKANLLKTTTKNLESHKHRIEWDSLAKAYQHCITLAVRLGVQFVWIDALCILQDSDPDWRRESSNMGKVYENAYLVIAASLAIDGDDGFFFDRSEYKELELPDKEHRQWPPAPPGNVFARVYEPQHAPFRDQWVNPVRDAADDLPLFGRAWAFQERILATRVLHFTPFEMLWECRTRIQCECGQNDERNPGGMKFNFAEALRPGHALLQDRNATWGDIVGEYTSRDLTFAKDKLVALSATAQQMSHRWLGQYVAGMWNNFLLDSLLWVRHSREDYPKPRHEEHVAPTWSWASVDGQIRDNPENVPSRDLKYWLERDLWHRGTWPEVVDVQVETVGDDKFGALKSGHLKLRGRIFHAVLRNPDDRKYSIEHTISPPSSESEEEPTVLEETFTPDVDLSQGVSVTSDGSPLIGLLFRAKASQKLYALIFKYSTREPDTFERIGIAVLSPEWNSGLEIKTLTIV